MLGQSIASILKHPFSARLALQSRDGNRVGAIPKRIKDLIRSHDNRSSRQDIKVSEFKVGMQIEIFVR